MTVENTTIYRRLQKHLDKLPIGYPATESGVELRLLKYLCTPEEAEIAMKLNFLPESLKHIYRRIKKSGMPIEELKRILDNMFKKGTINCVKKGDENYYGNIPLMIGMFEFQVNNLTQEFIENFEQYMDEGFLEEYNKTRILQHRTIPIEQSITPEHNIGTYDVIWKIIENSEGLISIANCICKQGKDLLGKSCSQTDMREICFQFRTAAKIFIERGVARQINKVEALEILKKAEDDGLVLQPGNTQHPSYICCCCGCCCELLVNLKKLNTPVDFFASNFYAEVDPKLCTGCSVCQDRCQMDAITLIDDVFMVNRDRCIGCGLCIPICPSQAIMLIKKEEKFIPPNSTAALYMEIMKKKAELIRMRKK